MSLVLYSLGVLINEIASTSSDLSVNILASIIYDQAKKIFNAITIRKGRDVNVVHPVIELALVDSFYNAIILSLNKTRDYYKNTSRYVYKKEILQITARIKDLTKLLKGQKPSGYNILLDNLVEVMSNSTEENTNRLVVIARNNLIGLPDKTQFDLEANFMGLFLVLFKEKYASDNILQSLLSFDMLQANLKIASDTNKKIDSLICSHMNIETELQSISSIITSFPNTSDFVEIKTMLIGIQKVLSQIANTDECEVLSEISLQQLYLDKIYDTYKYVELPVFEGAPRRVNLKDVYVSLELINRIAVTIGNDGNLIKMDIEDIDKYNELNDNKNPFIIEKMHVADVFQKNTKAFLLGDTGIGKSITAQHLLCCLSGYQSSESEYWKEERLKYGLNNYDIIPIYISLQDYYSFGGYGSGIDSIFKYLDKKFNLHNDIIDFIKKKVLQGKAFFVIEDCILSCINIGCVLADISDLLNNYSRCSFIIFCPNGNDEVYSQFSAFENIPKFEFARLSLKTMKEMYEKYFAVLVLFYGSSNSTFERFMETIRELGLIDLSEKPYWFVMLLMMNFAFDKIPNNIMSIHSIIIDNIISRFIAPLDGFSDDDKKNVFLVFESISILLFSSIANKKTVSRMRLIEIAEKHFPTEKALLLINQIISNDCELLVYNNEMISYTHKSLISALVAQYYKRNIGLISNLVDETVKSSDLWLEALTMFFDEHNYDILTLVLYMLENSNSNNKIDIMKISLSLLSSVDLTRFLVRPERIVLSNSITKTIITMIERGVLSISERILVSQGLSCITNEQSLMDYKSYFIKISSGIVMLGNDRLTEGEPYEYNIKYDYYAAKLPVTNFEYEKFLLDNPEYQLPFDEANIWNIKTRTVDKRFRNHPVVGVSIYDALKYCNWLNTKINLPCGYRIWLPSDPEWMKMYRGGKETNGIKNQFPDRIYPWGNEWIEGYANLPKLEKPICHTTAVGIFVEGKTPYGCLDCCGNILEWTTTSWGGTNPEKPEYTHPYTALDGRENLDLPGLRITRGGSFLFSEGDAKCSCRLDPDNKFPDTGFRVFLVPIDK